MKLSKSGPWLLDNSSYIIFTPQKYCEEHLVVFGLWQNDVLSTFGLWPQQYSLEHSEI